MKTWNKSSLLLISFSLSWLYLAIHPMTSLFLFSCDPTPEPTPPFSLSVPVRKQRGNYVAASTFLSSHSMFP